MNWVKLNKTILCLLSVFLAQPLFRAQSKTFSLSHATAISYKQHVYCAGIKQKHVYLFRCNNQLQVIDSAAHALSSGDAQEYLQINADTLHDFLNVYVQKKNTKRLDIFRFNQDLTLHSHIQDVEVARLNNQSITGGQHLFYRDLVFVMKHAPDSSGEQYFLNAYRLKSDKENFDYQFLWQYPFERKHIQYIKLLKADSIQVLLFVKIFKGPKTGHYFLKVDAKNGHLVKVVKLREGPETQLMPPTVYENSADKRLYLYGQLFNGKQYKPAQNMLSNVSASVGLMYVLVIDSMQEVLSRKEFNLPIKDVLAGNQKSGLIYLVKSTNIARTSGGNLALSVDVYKQASNAPLCFYYAHSQVVGMAYDGETYVPDKCTLELNTEIENFYRNRDKLDMNGKMCTDSLQNLPLLFESYPGMPVKLGFGSDAQHNGHWILKKQLSLKNQVVLATLGLSNNIYQLKSLLTLSSEKAWHVWPIGPKQCVTAQQENENIFRLDIYPW